MKTLLVLAIVVAAVGGWWHGYRTGVLAERDHVRAALFDERATSSRLQAELAARLDVLQAEREQSDSTLAALRESLAGQAQMLARDTAELELYRRISGPHGERGIQVDKVSRSRSDPERIDITLVQLRGRDRVSGDLSVSVKGFDEDGAYQRTLYVPDTARSPAFDFRFFETVSVALPLELAGSVETLEIAVEPRQREHQSQLIALGWDEITGL